MRHVVGRGLLPGGAQRGADVDVRVGLVRYSGDGGLYALYRRVHRAVVPLRGQRGAGAVQIVELAGAERPRLFKKLCERRLGLVEALALALGLAADGLQPAAGRGLGAGQQQVVLVKPERFEEAAEIADHLRNKHTVVLNLEAADKVTARRLVDFLSGAAYVQEGNLKRVSSDTFLITPDSVGLTGGLADEIENSGFTF